MVAERLAPHEEGGRHVHDIAEAKRCIVGVAAIGRAPAQPAPAFRLTGQWAIFEGVGESRPPAVVCCGAEGAVLQGGVSCSRVVRPGTWPLGKIGAGPHVREDASDSDSLAGEGCLPRAPIHAIVLAAPERPDREDLPKYDRAALVDISLSGDVTVSQADGHVARLQLANIVWLRTSLQPLPLDAKFKALCGDAAGEMGFRRAGTLVFCEGMLPGAEYHVTEDVVIGTLPPDCRPDGGRRLFMALSYTDGQVHVFRVFLEPSGRVAARRSHTQGRARDGHIFEVAKRQPGALRWSLGTVRFTIQSGPPLPLLAGARAPLQHAARKQLAYLGLGGSEAPVEESEGRDMDGFQVATCTKYGTLVMLEGAVIVTARHRYTAFAQLPPGCWPTQMVTILVARGLPTGKLALERLDVTEQGECLCPQLPTELGVEHVVHFCGAVFGAAADSLPPEMPPPKDATTSEVITPEWRSWKGCVTTTLTITRDGAALGGEGPADRRLAELESRDRRFRGKFQSAEEFLEFEKTLQWFRAHDCTESHRLTHSCFKGRSDFTQTGMLVFDTEEDLEGLNKAIAWLYDRRIPVVLMERQTRVFPLIFDIDLKVTSQKILDKVPMRVKKARPWQGAIDFCRWPAADYFVLSEDMFLIRHMGRVIFQFFPDLPLLDICVFNASGWDRCKDIMKVSIHLVCPYVLVTPDRLCAIRERILEYFGECSELKRHPLKQLLEDYLTESDDNTWDKVVDQTVTSGTNGLRMPYCDKAQRILKRDFAERKARGEVFTERELADQHAYVREEMGRPCLPEGILRLLPVPPDSDDFALPPARWMCKGKDLPIDEWIRLGRCRYTWRVPLAPPGPTPWRPPLKYQWAEPSALWEDRVELKGSPVVRTFHGSADEFRHNWDEAVLASPSLQGRWLATSSGARWRGGLEEGASHEVRYVARAGRVVLLLAPEVGAAKAFAEIRRVLSGWTAPDDKGCVPLCGSPLDSHSAALHTIVTPSDEFPDIQGAIDAVPVDEHLHRVLICCGEHKLPRTLLIRRPLLLEGEGRWETTLRSFGMPVLRFEGEAASTAMVRNLHLEVVDTSKAALGDAAIEMDFEGIVGGEPAIVGCTVRAAGRWGTCVRARGSAPQIVRSRFSGARWGVVLVNCSGRVEDNEFIGVGDSGLVMVGGSPWVHRNVILDNGGAGILAIGECHAVLEGNEIKDCMTGLRIVGKRSEIQMRGSNRLLHNGLNDEHQIEAPPSVIPCGSTAVARSCRPFPFLPKNKAEIVHRMEECRDAVELTIFIRAARRFGHFAEAAEAHRRLGDLRKLVPKGPAASASPASAEVAIASKAWDGRALGFGDKCVSVEVGTICEVWRRDESGWLLVITSQRSRGWCSPHVLFPDAAA